MATTGLKVSKRLEDFIKFYDEIISAYKYAYDMVNECQKLECDIKHKLELKLYKDRNERARLLTQLEYCLRDRRYYKDRVEELEPFAELFLSKEKDRENITKTCTNAINYIKNVLGGIRKAEDYHKERTYKPRILKDTYGEQ